MMTFKQLAHVLMLLVLLLAGSLFAASPSYANPPEINYYFKNKPPLGSGTVNWLFFKMYDATVWTDGATWTWQRPFALQLTYARNFSKATLAKASIAEIQRIYRIDAKTAAYYYSELYRLFPAVKAGDRVTAIYLPGKGVIFYYNSRLLGTVKSDAFAHSFLGIWFSPNARDPDVRRQILHCDNC